MRHQAGIKLPFLAIGVWYTSFRPIPNMDVINTFPWWSRWNQSLPFLATSHVPKREDRVAEKFGMIVVPRGVDHEYKGMSTFVPRLGVCRLDFYKPPLGVLEIHFPLFHLLDSQSFVLSLHFCHAGRASELQ